MEDYVETSGLLMTLFAREKPDIVVHLAAQARARYLLENPRSYLGSNIVGTFELIEAGRGHSQQHMLTPSTSSAFVANTEMPYRRNGQADHQMLFYAAIRRRPKAWRIAMPICPICRSPCSGSSRSMAMGGGPTWRC